MRSKQAKKISFDCDYCETPTEQYWSNYKRKKNHFCSLSCGTSYRNKYGMNPSHLRDLTGKNNPMFGRGDILKGEKNWMFGRTGEKCPNWKGGRHARKDGYVRVTVDGKRVLEHRLIAQLNNVDIEGKVLHHKNGVKSDNRIENLLPLTQSDHINLHRADL